MHQINPFVGYLPDECFVKSCRQDCGLSPAGIAILRGHTGTAQYLIDEFYDNDRVVYDNDTMTNRNRHRSGFLLERKYEPTINPLHLACFMGMEKVVISILEKGAYVDSVSVQLKGSTPLMLAVARPDNDAIISLLLRQGADIWIRNNKEWDGFLWAVLFKAHENPLCLVEAGARTNFRFNRI